MDQNKIKEALTALLKDVASQAEADARAGESDIGSIFRQEGESLHKLDVKAINKTISHIETATATREGALKLMNGIMLAARVAARIA
jgi:hypothetical protein